MTAAEQTAASCSNIESLVLFLTTLCTLTPLPPPADYCSPGLDGSICSSNGYCEEETRTCVCKRDFVGSRCERGICDGVACVEGHGSCVRGTCVCSDNWGGAACETDLCEDVSCGDNGYCSLGACICYSGWSGSNCTEVGEFYVYGCLRGAGRAPGCWCHVYLAASIRHSCCTSAVWEALPQLACRPCDDIIIKVIPDPQLPPLLLLLFLCHAAALRLPCQTTAQPGRPATVSAI